MLYDNRPSRKRSWQWFYLGMSIGTLLMITDPVDFLRALNTLWLEYENETESKQQKMVHFHWFGYILRLSHLQLNFRTNLYSIWERSKIL